MSLLVLIKTVIVLFEYKRLHAVTVHGEKISMRKCQSTKTQQKTTLLQHGCLQTVLHVSGILQNSFGLYSELSVIQNILINIFLLYLITLATSEFFVLKNLSLT